MDELFDTARSLQRAGQLEEAESVYRELLAGHPDCLKAWNNLGVLLERTGRPDEAVDVYQRAIELDGQQAMLHYNHGHALHEAGHLVDAVESYRRALTLQEDDGDTHANLAMALHQSARASEAVPHYQRAMMLLGTDAVLATRLGECLYVVGHVRPAREAYARATSTDPDYAEAFAGLARCDEVLREFKPALRWYQRACKLDPQLTAAHEGSIRCAHRLGLVEEIERGFAEWNRAQPDHPVAEHMRAALLGDIVPDRASVDYIANVFDGFSVTFDQTLERLQYRAPELIGRQLKSYRPDGALDVLDLGCGTGLCGPLVRPLAKKLVGIDLSSGMLTKAKERGDYDELIQVDIPAYLALNPQGFDSIIAADTLCYFGDLREVLHASASALRQGGICIFTVERAEREEAGEHGFILRAHGRYAHDEASLRALLNQSGFNVLEMTDEVLRHEGGEPQHGWLVTAERTTDDVTG